MAPATSHRNRGQRASKIQNVDAVHRNFDEMKFERLCLKFSYSFERPGPHALTRHFKTPGRSTNESLAEENPAHRRSDVDVEALLE